MAAFNRSTDRAIVIARGPEVQVVFSDPTTTYETFGDGLDNPGDSLSSSGIEGAALSFVKKYLGKTDIAYTSGYRIGKMTYAYVHQTYNNKKISNAVANIAWKGELVVAFGHSFVKIVSTAEPIPKFKLEPNIVTMVEKKLNGARNGHPAKLEYLANPNGHLSLVHVIQIQNETSGTWYEAFMDAHSDSGQLLSLTDFVSHATYKVLPIPGEAVPPNGFKVLTDPVDKVSSPSGWHSVSESTSSTVTTTTAGNNVISYKLEGTEKSTTSESSSTLNFNYSFDASKDPAGNLDAARVNAFYVANTVHDFFHRYGFVEAAFNFQVCNFNRGGKGGDRVEISIQETTIQDSFSAPPEGQSGICHLSLYYDDDKRTTAKRDAAFDNGIIIHELTHGMTVRMTGGGTGQSLQTVEARGLGEGWSDAVADWAYQTSAPIKDYAYAVYATGKSGGSRKYPYSTSKDTNPLKYSDVQNMGNDVHMIGQVWANILHNVHADLVEKYGFSTTALTNADGTEGNVVFLRLLVDALALQPVSPTFAFARQAWIQADANRYNGAHQEVLWKAFASRGLGVGAENYKDSSLLPSHFKPVVIKREQMKIPPRTEAAADAHTSGVADGSIVSVIVNPKTVVTIFGLVTATWEQKAKAERIDADQKSKDIVFFDGFPDKKSLALDSDLTKKTVTWGPFDTKMTVELTFYHRTGNGANWEISAIKADKMKEHLDDDLKTAVSVIPTDDGGHGSEDCQNTTLTVTRMTLT